MSTFVNIGGLKLKIFPRKALDVIQLAEYVRRSEQSKEPQNQVFQYVMIVRDSLKNNIGEYAWWRVITRWRIKRALSLKRIAGCLSLLELSEITRLILISEGISENEFEALKKKVEETATSM
ncbi:MAG: hypothetical protein J0L60_06540 [Ignavibacteria bacterium]|nr:hypothetical protein [Ignavibacteria bacterium]